MGLDDFGRTRYLEVIRVFDTFHNKSGLTDLGERCELRLRKYGKMPVGMEET